MNYWIRWIRNKLCSEKYFSENSFDYPGFAYLYGSNGVGISFGFPCILARHDHSHGFLDIHGKRGSVEKESDNEKPHSPHRATIMAMILPGSGQIYNRQWWKLPILYGGIGATVYGLSWNMKYYKKYRTAFVDYTAYLNALEADPETPYPANSSWDKLMLPGKTAENYNASMQKRLQEQLKTKKDNYKRNRDLLYIVSGAIYAIQIIDATVFAHFYDFEINDDLSMNLRPSTGFSPVSGGTVGLTLTFNF